MAAPAAAAAAMDPELIKLLMERQEKALDFALNVIKSPELKSIKDKFRWLTVSIDNLSGETLKLKNTWFDSGRFWDSPDMNIPNGTTHTFGVCNKNGTILQGVSGHQEWQIGNSGFYMGVSYSNPYAGSYKYRMTTHTHQGLGEYCWKHQADKPHECQENRPHVVTATRKGQHVVIVIAKKK